MDHDHLFKELISTFFVEFLELLLPDVRTYVEAGSVAFLEKEIFTDVTSGERLVPDLVAKVRFKGSPAFFIIHVETQAHSQKDFGRRLFRYFSRLYDKYAVPVYPIVVFSFDSPRKAQADVHRVEFPNKVVMEFRYDVIQLNRLNWRDFAKKSNPVAAALMAKMDVAPGDRARVKLECLRLLVTLKLNQAKTRLISGFVDSYLKLGGEQLAQFEAEVKAAPFEQKEKVMEIVTSWMEEGLRRGRKEGKREGIKVGIREGKREGIELGQIEATRDNILEILEARFSRVPASLRKTLKSIVDRRELKLLLREAATVTTLKSFDQRLGNGQSRQRH